jgi:hypothetical protein
LDAPPIDLSTLSFTVHAGDILHLQELGAWQAGEPQNFTDTDKNTIAVFSSSSTLLGSSSANRVPGAISAGVPVSTPPTFFASLPTDIPQDFFIGSKINPISSVDASVDVQVPVGAKFLFIAAYDSHYSTNEDPNRDYMVRISPFSAVPEPSSEQLLALGFALTFAFSTKRLLASFRLRYVA